MTPATVLEFKGSRMAKRRRHKPAKTGMNPEACAARDLVLAERPEAVSRITAQGAAIFGPIEGKAGKAMSRISAPCDNEGAAWRSAAWRLTEYAGEAWAIVCVEPQSERKVAEVLKEAGHVCFAPVESVWRNGPKRTAITRPLLPGYVFALIEPHQVHTAASAGAHGVVQARGRPVDLAEFIAVLREAERAGIFDHTFMRGRAFEVGQTVRIMSGSYANVIGVISQKGKSSAKIDAAIFGGVWPITAELDRLEAA